MTRILIKLLLLTTVIIVSCIDAYSPSELRGDINYLVVNAFLNATDGVCTVTLSRTTSLSTTQITTENNAIVSIEDEHSATHTLVEVGSGVYEATGLIIQVNSNYKVIIHTMDGETYESELISVLNTPPIDSVSWKTDENGVGVYVNSHDPTNNTRYYYWKFTETWRYSSEYYAEFKLQGNSVVSLDQIVEPMYYCWNTANSKVILVGSSSKLSEDVISEFRLITLPWNSAKLRIKYSILVEQRAIEPKAYEYWQQLRKNTEELGTIFDPLPSISIGNIKCVSDSRKIALGYFNAATVEKRRIYISPLDIIYPPNRPPIITGYESCELDSVYFGQTFVFGSHPVSRLYENGAEVGYTSSSLYCVDCRLQGGVTSKPLFWED